MSKATLVVVDGVSYPLDDTTAVDFSEAQSLTAAEKQQARDNIGAASEDQVDAKADKTTTVNGHPLSANVTVTKGDVGLGNVDNTSDANKPVSTAQQAALDDKADVIVDTASGAIASFPDGAAVPANDITIGIEPVQSGSGDPSPTNVRPITGWTGANVTRTGFNQWDEEWEVGALNNDGSVDSSSNRRTTSFIPVIPNTTYFQQSPTAAYLGRYAFYNADKQIVKYDGNGVPSGIKEVTAPENAHYLRITFGVNYGTTYNHDICINISDPAKNGTYEPGHVVTYHISWQSEAGTVYGGTLDVTTGVLTVDRDNIASYAGETFPGAWISNMDVYTVGGTPTTGAQVVYELATSQTYQLTPVEIEMLLGDNNVWADTGDSTVTYRADTKLYIQKINAPTDDDTIADAQIASGRYFIVGGNLYRSTTTIPAGDTITPGTNCILTNLADALNALNT